MTTFIFRRTFQMIGVLLLLSFACFALMSLMPGDPIDIMLSSNPKMTSADVERLKSLYGLNQPLYERYFNWMSDILSGNLGYSRTYKIPVSTIIGPRLFNTFLLSISSLILSLCIALPLGIWAAMKKGSRFDYFLNFFAFTGISIPSFWLGLLLIIVFSVWLGIFPAGGTQSVEIAPGFFTGILDRIHYLVLPVLSLTALQTGSFVRYTRSAMLEVLSQDYLRTAKSKGISNKRVLFIHALKNALIPIITIISISSSSLFSGAIITETIFAYQGVGKLTYDSIIGNDYNVAMISFIISIAMVLFMNLVADILYAFADPRISYQ